MKDNTLREQIENILDSKVDGLPSQKLAVEKLEALLAEEVRKAILAGWRQAGEGYNNEYWGGPMTQVEVEKQVIEDALIELEKESK